MNDLRVVSTCLTSIFGIVFSLCTCPAAAAEPSNESAVIQATDEAGNAGIGPDGTISGMRFDDEYVIFVVDTSGSMRRYAWDRVQQLVRSTLERHTSLAGFQLVNDNGEHLLPSSTGQWLQPTPETLERVYEDLGDWEAFSNS
ncbi:MAG: hypothetical protein R3305_00900, partial [Gammaproteobacteria bacterium]|nr:hypothetical protein [Gammaproteobacteria bacterium]